MSAIKVEYVPVGDIVLDESFNCRGQVNLSDCVDLAKDIEKHGLQNPINLQRWNGRLRIVSGHRRFMACAKILGWTEMPAMIREEIKDDETAFVWNLTENIKRKDLTLLQEARAVAKFDGWGLSAKDIARRLDKSEPWVKVRLDLLTLEPEIQQAADTGVINQNHIKALKKLGNKEARFGAVKQIKEAKERGDKVKAPIVEKKVSPFKKRRRDPSEIYNMNEKLVEIFGPCLATRYAAWITGDIMDIEFHRDIKLYAGIAGKHYDIPQEVLL